VYTGIDQSECKRRKVREMPKGYRDRKSKRGGGPGRKDRSRQGALEKDPIRAPSIKQSKKRTQMGGMGGEKQERLPILGKKNARARERSGHSKGMADPAALERGRV